MWLFSVMDSYTFFFFCKQGPAPSSSYEGIELLLKSFYARAEK